MSSFSSKHPGQTASALKKRITGLLKQRDFAAISALSSPAGKVISAMISLSYDKKSVISWRATEAIGLVSAVMAKTSPDRVRNIAGRLLWMIRDESGGIGWSAPEILGEIVRNNPALCSDIAPVIVSFHEEKMLTPGVLWAVGRMGRGNAGMTEYASSVIPPYLHSTDHRLRAFAARALGEIGASDAAGEIEKLRDDGNLIRIYEEGELVEKSVGAVASEALAKLPGLPDSPAGTKAI